MDNQKLLLPYNFTTYDKKALDFVIRTFVNRNDLEVTLFNVHTPMPVIETNDLTVMRKLKDNLNYLSKKIEDQKKALKAAKQDLLRNGFPENRVKCITKPKEKDIASEIIELARNDQFDLVIINHKPGRIKQFFTGSVFNKVVNALNNKTVCIVS